MKYFLMEEDKTIAQRPFLLSWHEKYDVRLINPQNGYKLPRRELLLIRANPETLFTDIISTPFFLVSEKVNKTLKMYEPRLMTKELVLMDKEHGKAERYFLPLFEEADCLGEGTRFNMDHSRITKIVLDETKIGDRSIFKVAGVEKQYIIGCLDIVESILKRGCVGMALTELAYIPAGTKAKRLQEE